MKQAGGGSGGTVPGASGKGDKRRDSRRRGSWITSGRLALIISVIGLVLIVLFIIPRGQNRPFEPRPQSEPVAGVPINTVDPTSGKPTVAGITSIYKGHTIGHCCEVSKREWEALSDAQKDAAIRRFLR
jgi:hypothetical protein